MNKIELIGLIREIVRDELKELLKSKNGRAVVREMISKEVRLEVERLLVEMEQSEGEVIQETHDNTKLIQMVERGELPPKNGSRKTKTPSTENVAFTKNPKLNAMLNETLRSVTTGEAQLPSQLGADGQMALLKEQYANMGDDWKTMPGNFTSTGARTFTPTTERVGEESGKSVQQMLPDTDVNGNPMMVQSVPDHISKALTRDYRKLMKKVEEKRG